MERSARAECACRCARSLLLPPAAAKLAGCVCWLPLPFQRLWAHRSLAARWRACALHWLGRTSLVRPLAHPPLLLNLQRHNARRRKRQRDSEGGGSTDLAAYDAAVSAAAAVEMAKLAGYGQPPMPISAQEMQASLGGRGKRGERNRGVGVGREEVR